MLRSFLAQAAFVLVAPLAIAAPIEIEFGAGESSFETRGFRIGGGAFLVKTGSPLGVYGTVRSPGSSAQLTYFLICKSDPQKEPIPVIRCRPWIEGQVATDDSRIEVNKKTLELRYEARLDPATNSVASQLLTVNGKKIDLADGRVLLVDFSGKDVSFKQVKATPSPPRAKQAWDSFLQKTIKQLSKEHSSVGDFLR